MQKAFAIKIVLLGAVLFASAALAFAAQAQTQGGMMHHDGMMESPQGQPERTQGGMMKGMMQHGGGMQGCGMMHQGGTMEHCSMGGGTAYAEGRLAFLKAYLAITDQQQPAWETYADALTSKFEAIKGVRDTAATAMQAKAPTSRLDAHIAALEAKAATLKELRPALTALYAALSEEQKKKADELLLDVGCMM